MKKSNLVEKARKTTFRKVVCSLGLFFVGSLAAQMVTISNNVVMALGAIILIFLVWVLIQIWK